MRFTISSCELLRASSSQAPEPITAVSARPLDRRGNAADCPSGHPTPLHACVRCPHFLRTVPSDDGRGSMVECLFLESDPIDEVMTRASRIVVVEESRSLEAAAAVARRSEIDTLLVFAGDEIVGWIDKRDVVRGAIAWPHDPVAVLTRRRIPVVSRTTPLGTVATILDRQGRRAAFIVDGERVVGLVTKEDLRRLGVIGRTPQ